MACITIARTDSNEFPSLWAELLKKLSLESALLENKERLGKVREIVEKVHQGGDAAVAELTETYDGVALKSEQFRIPDEALQLAHEAFDPELLAALRVSIENVRNYQQAIRVANIPDWTENGVTLGLRYTSVERVGICIPGASAPLVSTVIMTVVPAQVAGVKETAIITAPSFQGSVHPTILGLCYELGVTDVYRVSGAQAVAALAFGTDTINKVDKIVGPSNWWGQLAKKEVYGLVDIDSFAGPSEVLIVADETANPAWVAADMLSQAEHAPGSAILVTDGEKLAQDTAKELDIQLEQLDRSAETREFIEKYSMIVLTGDLDESVRIANEFAVEHLQIQCADSDAVAQRIANAGAIFIGPYSPVATGDYIAGPSHTLPTGSSARFFSALNVNDFLKQSSIIRYSEEGLKQAAEGIERIARAEGLDAHEKSVSIRRQK